MKLALPGRLAICGAAFLMSIGSMVGPANFARAAADSNEVDTPNDARLDVYPAGAGAPLPNSSAAVWLLFVLIGAVTLGFLFWDPAERTLSNPFFGWRPS